MPHDYDDDDAAGFGLRETIDEASSVNASGGYSIVSTPFVIAPYRSLAVFVKPHGGGAFSVSVTWDFDGDAGGATVTETKDSTLLQGETLIFRNHGVQVTDVTITASSNTAYAVMPSDVDPLPDTTTTLPFLILEGVATNIVSPPVGDSDHAKFGATPVWTNDLSEWTFDLDGSGRIRQVSVDGPGLYYLACQFEFEANAAIYRRACAINTSGNVNQTYNDPNFFGTSPFWQDTSIQRQAAMIEAWCPINASGGYFTVEPSTNVVAGRLFLPDYLFIVKHPLTS